MYLPSMLIHILDSWSSQTDATKFSDEVKNTLGIHGKEIETHIIPPETTKFVQSLGVYFLDNIKL